MCALSAMYRSAWQDAQPNKGGVSVLLQVNSQTSQSSESVGLAALFTLCRQL